MPDGHMGPLFSTWTASHVAQRAWDFFLCPFLPLLWAGAAQQSAKEASGLSENMLRFFSEAEQTHSIPRSPSPGDTGGADTQGTSASTDVHIHTDTQIHVQNMKTK